MPDRLSWTHCAWDVANRQLPASVAAVMRHLWPNALQRELAVHKCTEERIEVWQRGVDTNRFNPGFRSEAMRAELSDGHPEAPLLVHVGRLGAGEAPCCRAIMSVLLLGTFIRQRAMPACSTNISHSCLHPFRHTALHAAMERLRPKGIKASCSSI